MEQSRQEIQELTQRMTSMLPELKAELQEKYPNVAGLEVGLKRKAGELADTLCFRVVVKTKVGESELKPEEIIPKVIRDIPTDVILEHFGIATEDTAGYDLLTGGIQIDAGFGGGTLGCFVTIDAEPAASKKIYLLTNHHVIVGDGSAVGSPVGQPSSPSKCRCCLCYDIAELTCGERGTAAGTATTIGTTLSPAGSPNTIDAAIAKLLGQDATDPKTVFFSNSIEEIGPIFGSFNTVLPGDRVRKRGKRTGLTFGRVEATAGVTFNEHDKKDPTIVITYNTPILISPLAETPVFSNEGDSGAVVVNSKNQVVALNFAAAGGYNNGVFSPTGQGLAFAISLVTTRLGISVLVSGTDNSIPLSGSSEAQIKPIRVGTYVSAFEKQIRSIPQGEMFYQILMDNRNEVMDLINDNREVKLAWHRLNGPEYIGHVLKKFSDSQHTVPASINGYSLQNLLIKMSDVLERNGSSKLAKAVDDYSAFAFSFADGFNGADSLRNALQRVPICPKCGKPIHQEAHAD